MSCWKWKEGLCIGGDCANCKSNPDRPKDQTGRGDNLFLGLFLIGFGVCLAVLVSVFL